MVAPSKDRVFAPLGGLSSGARSGRKNRGFGKDRGVLGLKVCLFGSVFSVFSASGVKTGQVCRC